MIMGKDPWVHGIGRMRLLCASFFFSPAQPKAGSRGIICVDLGNE
jgi:hypothetical protein